MNSSQSTKETVGIIGSGNWGTTVSKIITENLQGLDGFSSEVRMWVHEEIVDGKKLSEIINTQHENVKYLPGVTLPSSVKAESDIRKLVENSTILVVVLPHQFVGKVCSQIGRLPPETKVISLVKGFDLSGGINLFSDVLGKIFGVEVSVLMGANVADEVARGSFCETTIASRNPEHSKLFKLLFQNPNFRVQTTRDVTGTELCGALKNIVAVAAGFSDGLGYGSNTKAAVIRIGLMEMKRFAQTFYKGVEDATFFESCGVGDLLTSCSGGRNHRLSREFVLQKKGFDVLEKELLNGQKLQGPLTAKETNSFLKQKGLEKEFPLFTAVHKIAYENLDPREMLRGL